jgi:CRP-like cAMP-binding protein
MNRATLAQLLTEVVTEAPLRAFAPGSKLFEKGNPALGCYIIQRGAVELTLPCADGGEIVVELVQAGGLIGLSGSFGENYILGARAASATSVAFIERKKVRHLFDTHADAKRLMLLALSENIEHVQRLTASLLSKSRGDFLF